MVVNCPDCEEGEIFFLNHAAQPCEHCYAHPLIGVSEDELTREAERIYDAYRAHQLAIPVQYLPPFEESHDQRYWLSLAAERLSV